MNFDPRSLPAAPVQQVRAAEPLDNLSEEDRRTILGISGSEDQQAILERQIAMAGELRKSGQQYRGNSPLAAGLYGLDGALKNVFGALGERDATREQQKIIADQIKARILYDQARRDQGRPQAAATGAAMGAAPGASQQSAMAAALRGGVRAPQALAPGAAATPAAMGGAPLPASAAMGAGAYKPFDPMAPADLRGPVTGFQRPAGPAQTGEEWRTRASAQIAAANPKPSATKSLKDEYNLALLRELTGGGRG
jgi:hypothetical protein